MNEESNISNEIKKQDSEKKRKLKALPKIHVLTNQEMSSVAGGHIHWDRKLHSNWTGVC